MNFSINKTGFWEGNVINEHWHDPLLAIGLISFFRSRGVSTVLDLGCGAGDYCKTIVNNSMFCECYDGNPETNIITDGLCNVYDLSTPMDLQKTFDVVMSLEVGEHIPVIYEKIFLDNITRHASTIIVLSWAIPGQGGQGHVNCQTNDYIISEIALRNYVFNKTESQILRNNVSLSWFKDTLMIFEKK
jgi:2-polyprenyl-3-methyl-5-hydroxy-6-metoxy-1,4-benzoquinol methylase